MLNPIARLLLRLLLPTSLGVICVAGAIVGCRSTPKASGPGQFLQRTGDEIVVCGQLVHTGTPVLLWMDPGGYDAYRVDRRFAPLSASGWDDTKKQVKGMSTPNRYNIRQANLTEEQLEQVRGGGWDLPLLQTKVDQFVLHYDQAGTSRQCFNILHDHRDLSVHFMLDLDGTIYQTLDLKERAWHATIANDRSIGIEIANIGAYAPGETGILEQWYRKTPDGKTRVFLPLSAGMSAMRTPNFIGYPARPEPVVGEVQGRELRQYDLTPEQYKALTHLTATLCTVFPRIQCDYPRDGSGKLLRRKLTETEFINYRGVLGHYHVQADKIDPGPAMQWDTVIDGAKQLMKK